MTSSGGSLPTFNVGGLASGLDTNSIVSKLLSIEKLPQQRIQQQSAVEQQRVTDLNAIVAQLHSLATAAAALSDPGTWTTSSTISSSDPTRVTATGSGAPAGGYSIGVSKLARAAQLTQQSALTAAANDDRLEISVGAGAAIHVNVAKGDDLETIANAINATGTAQVHASVIDSKLVLTGLVTGAANTISVTSVGGGTLAADLGLTQTVAPADAAYTIDGTPGTSSSNTLTNLATGLTVSLLGVTASPATITVGAAGPNNAGVEKAIQGFVTAYNATIDLVDGKVNEQKVAKPTTASDRLAGDLNADPSLLSLLSQLRSTITTALQGGAEKMDALSEAGLSTGGGVGGAPLDANAIRGDLKLDTAKLEDALTSRYDDVKALFTHAGTGAAQGLAQRVSSLVTGFAGAKGTLTGELAGENALVTSLGKQIADWDVRLSDKETALRQQFTAMETTLSQLQSQSGWLTSQIAGLGRTG